MRRIRGDEGFEAEFPHLFHRAHGVAARILGDADAAEDAAAEALARAFVHWGKVRDLPYREAWVVRVAANVALDALRRRRPVPAPLPGIGSADDLDQVVERLVLAGQVRRLSRRQQEVLVLRYMADMPEAEVASCLGVGVETVKEHAARAMRTLRARAEKEVGGAVV